MKRRTMVVTATVVVLALAVGIVLTRYVGDVALPVYALFLGTVLLALLLRRLRALLPPAVPFERFFSRSKARADRVDQLHTVERDIRMSMSSGHDRDAAPLHRPSPANSSRRSMSASMASRFIWAPIVWVLKRAS